VALLHQLCLQAFLETDLRSCYQALQADLYKAFPSNDRTLSYMLRHPKVVWQAKLSTWFGRTLTGLSYDTKLAFDNIPGYFFDYQDDLCLLYMPTPTRGLEVVAEARGLLQALQNGMSRYKAWLYINLQDLTSGDERRRSLNIMQLDREYPQEFVGMTLAQDVGIYRHDVRKALLSSENFTLESPYGYYFPAQTDADREQWLTELESLIIRAEAIVKEPMALRELLNLGIIHLFLKLKADRPAIFNTSCKESIDRGGKMNALLYWLKHGPVARSDAEKFLHVRALSIRERQIKKRRVDEFYALINTTSHDVVSNYCKETFSPL
jgi:hypothetical protein